MTKAWPKASMGEIAPLVRRPVLTRAEELYREIGIRSFGKGVFHKAPVTGLDIADKRVFTVKPGDLLFNIVFAWEGAVAVATEAERGMVGSHRFLTCVTDKSKADARFLNYWFTQAEGRDQLLRASPGGAGRNRTLGVEKLAAIHVPLPPLDEQRRIVARIEELAAKVAEAQNLRALSDQATVAFVSATHAALATSKPEPLSKFIELDEDATPIEIGVPYPQAGVRGFGGGLFAKAPVKGGETTYRTFNRLYQGALVMSQVKGWEGAVAMTPKELHGYFVSPEYRTFRCRADRCLPEYLAALVPTKFFWGRLKDATRGVGARRERTRPEQFLRLEFSMPSLRDQERAIATFTSINAVQGLQQETATGMSAMLPAILDKAFRGELS
ncbi:restriction endonuclease subunit S [Acetobacter sacchari]|uniref:Restriction endonuclease subunit S n=1 Tax=Acetobacter sacchari TaxID=2661687 RepID=A0ABS3LSU9_9PROT|nr:restriction endonuclease subunit S [Acetobacter sacchari]MBO1358985.1 restriction endonuclease subunit S [Acetobacter sacchari]